MRGVRAWRLAAQRAGLTSNVQIEVYALTPSTVEVRCKNLVTGVELTEVAEADASEELINQLLKGLAGRASTKPKRERINWNVKKSE